MAWILSELDDALAGYIIAGAAGTVNDVFSAKRSLDKDSLPLTICFCHTATPPADQPQSRNVLVEAFIEIRNSGVIEENDNPDDPKTKAVDRTTATSALFHIGAGGDDTAGQDLGDAISAFAPTITIQHVKVVTETQGFNPRPILQQGNAWVDTIHLELLVSPGNVA